MCLQLSFEPTLPDDLTLEQRRIVERALYEALQAGVAATIDRNLQEVTLAGTDLCTSVLGAQRVRHVR